MIIKWSFSYVFFVKLSLYNMVHSYEPQICGSAVVECLALSRDRGVAGSNLTGITVVCP